MGDRCDRRRRASLRGAAHPRCDQRDQRRHFRCYRPRTDGPPRRLRRSVRAQQEGRRSARWPSPRDPVATPAMGAYPELPFFRNPRQPNPAAEAAAAVEPAAAPFLDPALDEEHFRDRAAGHGPAAGRVTAGCFTGRAPQLRKLAAWLDGDGDGGVTVVTGGPGAGKSALLGLLVCAAHPGLRGVTQDLWWAAAARPSENPELAAVHARQRALPVILGSLTAQLVGGAPGALSSDATSSRRVSRRPAASAGRSSIWRSR